MRRLKRSTKQVIIAIVISLLIATLAFCAVYLVFTSQIKEKYQREIDEYELLMEDNQQYAYVAKRDIAAGEEVKEEDLAYQKVFTSLPAESFINTEDFGKVAVIDIRESVPVSKNMISENLVEGDLREEEFNVFYLSSNLKENDFIDLRIIYPNGEDYSVLSKKAVKGLSLEEGKCFLWLNAEEILRISSAIVDAYFNDGSKLYTVKYVEPLIQEATQVTYIPNVSVINLIKSDPNVVSLAVQSLSDEIRLGLEDRLQKFYKSNTNTISWEESSPQQFADPEEANETAEKEGSYYVD